MLKVSWNKFEILLNPVNQYVHYNTLELVHSRYIEHTKETENCSTEREFKTANSKEMWNLVKGNKFLRRDSGGFETTGIRGSVVLPYTNPYHFLYYAMACKSPSNLDHLYVQPTCVFPSTFPFNICPTYASTFGGPLKRELLCQAWIFAVIVQIQSLALFPLFLGLTWLRISVCANIWTPHLSFITWQIILLAYKMICNEIHLLANSKRRQEFNAMIP